MFHTLVNRFSKFGLVLLVIFSMSFASIHSAVAKLPLQIGQQSSQSLQSRWSDGVGFVTLNWLRASDRATLYSSTVYLSVTGNRISVFNTYAKEPFGQLARCGGLGCDLGKGALVATLDLVPKGNSLSVQNASAKASFLKGATCSVVEDYLQVLECSSSKGAQGSLPSLFVFAPGT